jgi:hypothetical protein
MALEPFAFQERIKVLEVAGRIAQLSFFFLRRSFFAHVFGTAFEAASVDCSQAGMPVPRRHE